MSSKSPPIKASQEKRKKEPRPREVVLRDESDAIIDTLKRRLESLQRQMARYQGDKAGRAADREAQGGTLDIKLTPHIASRMEIPAEELGARLQRLIGQIADPELKSELEHCRETAFFLFDTFRRIREKHEDLIGSLTADSLVMKATEFSRRLETSLHERRLPVQVSSVSPLPYRLALSPQAVITVLATLADLAVAICGQPSQIAISCPELDAAVEGEETRLCLQITSNQAWRGIEGQEAISSVAIRSRIRSSAIVDLLYVEKIIEVRGGSLQFFKRQGQVYGFEVFIPITLLERDEPAETAAEV